MSKMKSVLLIQYSQSGQLTDVARSVVAPLMADPNIEVTVETLRPKVPFPFPWPFLQFFDTFPSSVYMDGCELEPLQVDINKKFDLVILAYQVWFLSPSIPVTGFLKSEAGHTLLRDKPVVTLIACRDMWLMAQEQVKALLEKAGAKLVGNIALVDEAGTAGSFFATPAWVMSGNKGPHLFGLIPRAGVKPEQITASVRFGDRMADVLRRDGAIDEHLLQGLGAVRINEKLIASEKTARRSFLIWGKLFRSLGPTGAMARKPVIIFYFVFLFTLIVTFIPISILIKKLLAPFAKAHVASQKAYFAYPSGE
ncbi:MAG: dialkylresorcinol condensing enzyme [Gemmatimonadaceae bacterium]